MSAPRSLANRRPPVPGRPTCSRRRAFLRRIGLWALAAVTTCGSLERSLTNPRASSPTCGGLGRGDHFPELPQVACFDTAFHRRLPAVAQRLPLPRALRAKGIERYGFHGLSYEYVVATVGAATLGRAVIAHLGNGASLAAVRDGLPVDTTMGFTPTGGLMMGTRSGDLDPGVLVHLLVHEGYDAAAIERLVDHQSGLLGVSGVTSDMKRRYA